MQMRRGPCSWLPHWRRRKTSSLLVIRASVSMNLEPGREVKGLLQLCVFGASTDTCNLGVSALSVATLSALYRRAPGALVTVFDEGWGLRNGFLRTMDGEFAFRRSGARHSRRFHRRES